MFAHGTRRALGLGLVCGVFGGVGAGAVGAQVLDETLVPKGQFRLQLHGSFDSWESRFGRAPDGTEGVEQLGDDLTDPATWSLFPGFSDFRSSIRSLTGDAGYDPVLGETRGRVTQDVSTILWGGDLGVFDWLTVGGVIPWTRPRSAIDVAFTPPSDSVVDIGLNPLITSAGETAGFLQSVSDASAGAAALEASACAGGATAACATAQALAQRARDFNASVGTAYGATPFFPFVGSVGGTALMQAAQAFSDDLVAAGLSGLVAMPLATDVVALDDLARVPAMAGSGIGAAPLSTRPGIWALGDIELTARVRVLDNTAPREAADSAETSGGLEYRVLATLRGRLPTGTLPSADVPFDIGTGDGQTDLEVGGVAALRMGPAGLTVGVRGGTQQSVTREMRVARPEDVLAAEWTRASVTWSPGSYIHLDVVPTFHISNGLLLAGEYRYYEKRRDVFELAGMPGDDPRQATLDPVVLALESGVKVHQIGGGLRYDTVTPWVLGLAPRPLEVHVRLLHSVSGSGGQVPKITRVEAGLRLFRHIWGARPER